MLHEFLLWRLSVVLLVLLLVVVAEDNIVRQEVGGQKTGGAKATAELVSTGTTKSVVLIARWGEDIFG